jgi:hypothetical protein
MKYEIFKKPYSLIFENRNRVNLFLSYHAKEKIEQIHSIQLIKK